MLPAMIFFKNILCLCLYFYTATVMCFLLLSCGLSQQKDIILKPSNENTEIVLDPSSPLTYEIAKILEMDSQNPQPVVPSVMLNSGLPQSTNDASYISNSLKGYIDMHTHPLSHLGFGRKAMHGAPDINMIVPSGNLNCNSESFRARTEEEALGNCNGTHGGWGLDNICGDYMRAGIINYGLDSSFIYKTANLHGDHEHSGHPDFRFWPHQSTILHQQMWWEWIKRSYDGGLRVLVALTVNSETLADIINGTPPYDDRFVADVQIQETIRFVEQHDFMEIALSAADVRRIIRSNKLAVILGMEVDRIGNFGSAGTPVTEDLIRLEIRRLHQLGIRYIFPIHLIDNAFGGAAVYHMLFNIANKHQNGYFFNVTRSSDSTINFNAGGVRELPLFGSENAVLSSLQPILTGIGELPSPCIDFQCPIPPGQVKCCGYYSVIRDIFPPTSAFDRYRLTPTGHVNSRGLTNFGEIAINEMMILGMIIDLDHMSQRAMERTIQIAELVEGGYPLVFGHSELRETNTEESVTERSVPSELLERVALLGGMIGVGTANVTPEDFINKYRKAWEIMGENGVAIGSDANGFERLPRFRNECEIGEFRNISNDFYAAFFAQTGLRRSSMASATFDYVEDCGVTHYGLIPEFLFDIRNNYQGEDIYNNLMGSAQIFIEMWEKIESVSINVSSI